MSVSGMDANEFRNLNFNDLNKYDFIIIDDLSYAQKSALPALLNLVDGGINEKKFLPKVIIMNCGSAGELPTTFKQRFLCYKLDY